MLKQFFFSGYNNSPSKCLCKSLPLNIVKNLIFSKFSSLVIYICILCIHHISHSIPPFLHYSSIHPSNSFSFPSEGMRSCNDLWILNIQTIHPFISSHIYSSFCLSIYPPIYTLISPSIHLPATFSFTFLLEWAEGWTVDWRINGHPHLWFLFNVTDPPISPSVWFLLSASFRHVSATSSILHFHIHQYVHASVIMFVKEEVEQILLS